MKPIFVVLLIILVCPLSISEEYPRLKPRDYILPIRREYAGYGPLELIEASLVLSGLTYEETGPYLGKSKELITRFKEYLETSGGPESAYRRGELILDFLHESLFVRYDEFQTRTDVVFDSGVYNCVSSAVFYAALAIAAGLEVNTVNTEDHVFCSVRTEKGEIDVETTSPYGFNPGTKREFTDSFGKTGFTYVPPGNYAKRDPGDELKLLSFILQNRIAELQKIKNYFESVGLSVDRHALLGDNTSFQLMITEFVNYAAHLNKEGRYEEAISFLDYARERYRTGGVFRDIYATLTNNFSIVLTDQRRFDEAAAYIDEWEGEGMISSTEAEELRGLVADRKAYVLVNEEAPGIAEKELDEIYAKGSLRKDRYVEYIVYLYGKMAEEAGKRRDWLQAADIMEAAIQKIGNQPRLDSALKGYRNNFAISVHNQFADLYNSKQFQEARDVVEEGLRLIPNNKTLKQDLEIIRDTLSSQ